MAPKNLLPLLLTTGTGLLAGFWLIAALSSRMLGLVSCVGDAPPSAQDPFIFPVRMWGWRKEIRKSPSSDGAEQGCLTEFRLFSTPWGPRE